VVPVDAQEHNCDPRGIYTNQARAQESWQASARKLVEQNGKLLLQAAEPPLHYDSEATQIAIEALLRQRERAAAGGSRPRALDLAIACARVMEGLASQHRSGRGEHPVRTRIAPVSQQKLVWTEVSSLVVV